MNGLRFLYALFPFFVRRFLYAVSNASIIGVTGSSLSGLDRYSNLEPDAVLPELSLKPHERGSVPADPRGVADEDRADALTLGFVQQEVHDTFRMDAGDAVCGNRSSYLIALVLRIAFQLFTLACCRKLIRTGNADIKKYFHLASPSDVVRKSLNFQTISMLSRS